MRHLLIIPFFLFFFAESYAGEGTPAFEGRINFVKESVFDTTYITIMVKGKMARVEEHDQNNRIISTRLVDLDGNTVTAVSPDKKLYTSISVSDSPKVKREGVEVIKTGNHKEINGYTCYQWRVRDPQHNTEVAYWVVSERFDFFQKLLPLINRTEHSLSLYQIIPENDGFFPILTEERTLLRKDKLKISVLEIVEANLNPTIFEIPQGYQPLRN
jgi:hypothetical protein